MKQVIRAVLLCFGLACNLAVLAESGDDGVPSGRITNGNDVIRPMYKYMLGMFVSGVYQCGAVVVSPSAALTSGFCAEFLYITKDISKISLRGGSHLRGEGVKFPVIKITFHPRFVRDKWPYSSDYNIAVLHVPLNAFRGHPNIGPILVDGNTMPPDTRCFVLGWGQTFIIGKNADYLQHMNAVVITQAACAATWSRILSNQVTSATICAMPVNAGACAGDYGGPLVCRNKLAGLISFFHPGCTKDIPVGFVRISDKNVRDFIKKAALV